MFGFLRIPALTLSGMLLLSALPECQKKERLPDSSDYPAFVRGSARLLCAKMIECYSGLYFSLSPELRDEITVERCEKAALRDVDAKLKIHNDTMKKYSVFCYQAILESECKQVGNVFFWNPACYGLRVESEKVFIAAGYKQPEVKEEQIEKAGSGQTEESR